jgi:predicted phosphodiesterase
MIRIPSVSNNLTRVQKLKAPTPRVAIQQTRDLAVQDAYLDINIATRILESEGRGRSVANGDTFERPLISPKIAEKLGGPELAGEPGALLRIDPDKKVIFVGDLHGNIDNLRAIINKYGKDLQDGKIVLVLLGDAVHTEFGDLTEMHSSKVILDFIIQLKSEYPDNFHYLKGNHDSFSPKLKKADNNANKIQQGVEHRNYLAGERGEEYIKKVERFWEHCPLAVIIGDRVFAAHSSVVKGGASEADIIGAYYSPGLCRHEVTKTEQLEDFIEGNSDRYSYDDVSQELVVRGPMEIMEVYELKSILPKTDSILIESLYSDSQMSSIEDQMMWNRPDKQYRNDDVIAMRTKLGLRPDAALISGHNKTGESAYEQPGMHNHFILQSHYDPKEVPLYVLEVDKGKVEKVEVAPLQDEPTPDPSPAQKPVAFINAKTNYGMAT